MCKSTGLRIASISDVFVVLDAMMMAEFFLNKVAEANRMLFLKFWRPSIHVEGRRSLHDIFSHFYFWVECIPYRLVARE